MVAKLLLGASLAALITSVVQAQTYPNPTLPLSGTEQILCTQAGGDKACNPQNLAAYVIAANALSGVFFSNVASNGLPVGNDTTGLGSVTSPYNSCQVAIAAAGAGATVVGNGTCQPAAGQHFTLTKTLTLQGYVPNALTVTPASGQSQLFEIAAPGGGFVTLSNLALNGAGSAATLITIDSVTGGQTLNLNNVVMTVPAGQRSISSIVPNSFNLNIQGGSESGLGGGIVIDNLNSGQITINNFTTSMTPSVIPTSLEQTSATSIEIYADGPTSTYTPGSPGSNSANVTITGLIDSDTYPLQIGGTALPFGVVIANAGLTFSGSTLTQTAQATDTATECTPSYITTSLRNPIRTGVILISGNSQTINCPNGANAGPKVGFEAYPETSRGTASQSGNTLTFTYQEPLYSTSTFPNNIPASGATLLPSASAVLPETITYVSGTPGGLGSYTGSQSQSFTNLNVRIVGPNYNVWVAKASQSGTALTLTTLYANADTQVINPYEQVGFGPFEGMSSGTILNGRNGAQNEYITGTCTLTNGIGTCPVSVSQTVPSGPVFVGAANMMDSVNITANQSVTTIENPLHTTEGGFGFCGYETGVTMTGNYGYGNQYGFNAKGCPSIAIRSNVFVGGHRPSQIGALYASPNYILEHNTFVFPYSTAVGGLHIEQANDWSQTDVPYSSGGFISGNVFYIPIPNGGLGYGSGATDGFGVGAANYGPYFLQFVNSCKTVCTGTPGLNYGSFSTSTLQGDNYYNFSASPVSGYFWVLDTGLASWTGSAWTGFTQFNTNTLSSFAVNAYEQSALVANSSLTSWSPIVTPIGPGNKNVNVVPQSSSVIISGAPALTIIGGKDFYGNLFDPISPTFGAAQFQGGYALSGSLTNFAGQQYTTTGSSTGTLYYISPTPPMTALVTSETTARYTVTVAGTLVSASFINHKKASYDTTNGLNDLPNASYIYKIYHNGSSTNACSTGTLANGCSWTGSIALAVNDTFDIQYCLSGDSTGATCVALTNGQIGNIDTTMLVRQ
jgi:hypothetical protein